MLSAARHFLGRCKVRQDLPLRRAECVGDGVRRPTEPGTDVRQKRERHADAPDQQHKKRRLPDTALPLRQKCRRDHQRAAEHKQRQIYR